MRDAAIGLAVLILALGAWAAWAGARPIGARERQLSARREKLFAELVTLEEQHRAGQIDEAAFDSRRAAVVVELERLYGQIERIPGGEGLAA